MPLQILGTLAASSASSQEVRLALRAARALADRAGVTRLEDPSLATRAERERTVYRFDVAHAEGHLPGFRSAPGGPLVQETDRYAPVRGAMIVLADDGGTEADVTASWLAQMGWDVAVLDGVRGGHGPCRGPAEPRMPTLPARDGRRHAHRVV